MYEGALQDLIDELGQLPGVGPKSAQRMALHLLEAEPEDVERLTTAINAVRHQVKHCVVCGNLTEDDECSICRDPRRDPSVICVVQEPKDIQAIENSRVFRGRYHVLGGAIDPIHGIGPISSVFVSFWDVCQMVLFKRSSSRQTRISKGRQPPRI